jgi:hypothetical protein
MSMSIQERIARFFDPTSYFAFDHAKRDFQSTMENHSLVMDDQKSTIHKLDIETCQLRFLLDQAPMMDMITKHRFQACITKFAYVHPDTLAKASADAARILSHGAKTVKFPKSPTLWVVTPLMPKDRVIFTPNLLPGFDPAK